MFDTLKKKLALLITIILILLSVFQLLLIAGLPFGKLAWGGQNEVLPTSFRIGSVISILIYAVTAFVFLSRAGVGSLRSTKTIRIFSWLLAGYFCLGILMNLASRSMPERAVMTPVVILLAASSIYVARKD